MEVRQRLFSACRVLSRWFHRVGLLKVPLKTLSRISKHLLDSWLWYEYGDVNSKLSHGKSKEI